MNRREALVEIYTKWRERSELAPIQITSTDWNAVYEKVKMHRIVGIFYYYLINHQIFNKISPNIQEEINKEVKEQTSKQKRYYEEFKTINTELRAAGVQATVMKGFSFQRFFPEGARRSGDVDLIIEPKDMIKVKRILEEQFGFRVDQYEFYDFAVDEEKITDGSVDYIHVVYGNGSMWLEAHPATTYWSWVDLKRLHQRAVETDSIRLLTPIDCFHMAVAHLWNHNPQHLQHVSHGVCKLKLYVDLREIYLYLMNHGYKSELYQSIRDMNHVDFAFEALLTCEKLFGEQLMSPDFPTPDRILNREYRTKYMSTCLEDLIFNGIEETNRIKSLYYENLQDHQITLAINKYDLGSAQEWIDWNDVELQSYNNYYVPSNFFWPRRTVNYFYQFYNVPIKTKFGLLYNEDGLFIYGQSTWNAKYSFAEERFNFHINYLRFLFGNEYNEKPISILLQPKQKQNTSVFIGDGEFIAQQAVNCLSLSRIINESQYEIQAFIPWDTLKISKEKKSFLFDVITHHAESDLPAMDVWAGGMGSEKMFGCDYFAKIQLSDVSKRNNDCVRCDM